MAFPADLSDHSHILEYAPEPGFDLTTFHRSYTRSAHFSPRARLAQGHRDACASGLSNRRNASGVDLSDIHGVRNSVRDVPLGHPVHTRGSADSRFTDNVGDVLPSNLCAIRHGHTSRVPRNQGHLHRGSTVTRHWMGKETLIVAPGSMRTADANQQIRGDGRTV